MAGACECGNEPSGFIKCGEFLHYLGPVSFSRRSPLHGVKCFTAHDMADRREKTARVTA